MEPAGKKALLRRFANVALLIGGFGLGQGSIFIAQTWLVATGRMELLAAFGVHFSFAMLGIITVEAGSLTVLARQASHLIREGGEPEAVWQAYWETTAFRFTMALSVFVGIIAYVTFGHPGDFSKNYALYALPAFFLWAFNGAGFLDGLQKSGISGITGSIAYIASAIALILARDLDGANAGMALGGALSIGYALTVTVQYLSLAASGWRVRMVRPSAYGLKRAFREEFAMLAGLLPGQFYFRIQLMLSELFLGPNATALLVYAKQIVGAGSQVTGFIRRVEFPSLLQRIAGEPESGTGQLIAMQKLSLGFGALLTFVILLASLVIISMFGGFTREAWLLLSIFCLTILSESIGQSLVQILFARGLFAPAALIRILAVAIGVSVSYLFIGPIGIAVFVLADFCSHATVTSLSLMHLARRARAA